MATSNADSRPLNELSICCWNWKGGSADKIKLAELNITEPTKKRRQIIDTVFNELCCKLNAAGGNHPYPDIMLVTEAADVCGGPGKTELDLSAAQSQLAEMIQTLNDENRQGEAASNSNEKQRKEKEKLEKTIQDLEEKLRNKWTTMLKNLPNVQAKYGKCFEVYKSTPAVPVPKSDKQMLFWSDRLTWLPGRQLILEKRKPKPKFSNRLFVNILSPDVDNPAADILVCGWHGPATKSMKYRKKRKTFNKMMGYVDRLCSCDNVDEANKQTGPTTRKDHGKCTEFALTIVMGDCNYELVNYETKELDGRLNMHQLKVCKYRVDATLKKNRFNKKLKRAEILDHILCTRSWTLLRSFTVPYDPLGEIRGIIIDCYKKKQDKVYEKIRVLSDHPPIVCTLKAPDDISLFPTSADEDDEATALRLRSLGATAMYTIRRQFNNLINIF